MIFAKCSIQVAKAERCDHANTWVEMDSAGRIAALGFLCRHETLIT